MVPVRAFPQVQALPPSPTEHMSPATAVDNVRKQGPRNSADLVHEVLASYATNGLFRSFARTQRQTRKSTFSVEWPFRKAQTVRVDVDAGIISFLDLLPGVPPKSPMQSALRTFLSELHAKRRPAHRRIDSKKARVRCVRFGGNLSVVVTVMDCDYEYATTKLIQAVQEVHFGFLHDGPYYEYRVAELGLNPDGF